MKILMSKRKPGMYCDWYIIEGLRDGHRCLFLISWEQASNYAQAVRYWKRTWGKKYKAILLRNSEPMSDNLILAC